VAVGVVGDPEVDAAVVVVDLAVGCEGAAVEGPAEADVERDEGREEGREVGEEGLWR